MSGRRPPSVSFTGAQLRCVNEALALLEAEVESDAGMHSSRLDLVQRTRARVHAALDKAGIQP